MPVVSIIVPCYNEQATIAMLLDAIASQTYPKENLEVIIADGMSSDGTRAEIERFQSGHPDLAVRIVENVKRVIPSGLNRAIEAARGEYIVRLDGHSIPADDYVQRCLEAHRAGRGENVGGVWEIRPGGRTWVARAIAAAAAHPLGVGDAQYRFTTQAAYVDTVPFGSYRRDLVESIGKYDETLLTNEDYELNVRFRSLGKRIWLDPKIRSVYFARSSFGALARQYFRYGFWKLRMLRRYPLTLRWRQALPPLFVLSLALLSVAALVVPLARILLLLEVMVYFLILLVGAIPMAVARQDISLLGGIPLAIAVMHLTWGYGFLVSLARKS